MRHFKMVRAISRNNIAEGIKASKLSIVNAEVHKIFIEDIE